MTVTTTVLSGYLEDTGGYLTEEYLSSGSAKAAMGVQFEAFIQDLESPLGVQALFETSAETSTGFEFKSTNILHRICEGYLEDSGGYLTTPYLVGVTCAQAGFQFEGFIQDKEQATGMQANFFLLDQEDPTGFQSELTIADFPNPTGFQFDSNIAIALGLQFTAQLYNATNIRVLCDFESRGTASGGIGGTNAWGNTAGDGDNWQARIGAVDPTEVGDFNSTNLNTDIVEQRWQTKAGSVSSINLTCDTEITQGTTIDTLAILNHNISSSGTVVLQGSNDSSFGTVNTTINLVIEEENIYYIADELPGSVDQNRYWRFVINDSGNTDGFIYIGTILFGNSIIFQGECITDRIRKSTRHFANRIRTEGFTTVGNDRALKRAINLEFRNLQFGRGNYGNLVDIFNTARTTLKCLWIPTPPQASRFAAFGKLPQIPTEQHNVKSLTDDELDLITFQIEVDESL